MRRLLAGLVIFLPLSSIIAAGSVESRVTGQTVKYSTGAVEMDGYLAYKPDIKNRWPAVLVVHE
jgi:hypothetical protein